MSCCPAQEGWPWGPSHCPKRSLPTRAWSITKCCCTSACRPHEKFNFPPGGRGSMDAAVELATQLTTLDLRDAEAPRPLVLVSDNLSGISGSAEFGRCDAILLGLLLHFAQLVGNLWVRRPLSEIPGGFAFWPRSWTGIKCSRFGPGPFGLKCAVVCFRISRKTNLNHSTCNSREGHSGVLLLVRATEQGDDSQLDRTCEPHSIRTILKSFMGGLCPRKLCF